MKKYLNKSLFYQGDAKIILPLAIAYVGTFLITKIIIDEYFNWRLRENLYNGYNHNLIYSFECVVILILYLIICYIIIVGMFKRKKWSTLLSGPFSRLDIRKRELILIIICAILYLIAYLIIIGQGVIKNAEIIRYIGSFNESISIDVIRIISISTITIGGLALLDSIFANTYYLIGSGIFIFIYFIALLINLQSGLYSYINYENKGIRYVYNGIMEYLNGVPIGNSMSKLQIITISAFFIITGVILIFIAKRLTDNMLVEHMNEGIILNFPKKIAEFMLKTFIGIIIAPYLSNLINDFYFQNSLFEKRLFLLRIIIIIITSFITHILLKKFKRSKKEKYYLW